MVRLAAWLARNAPGERSLATRAVAVLCGLTLFAVIVPGALVAGARWLAARLGQSPPGLPGTALAWLAVAVGVALAAWTVAAQVTLGRGTPVPVVPTQRLLTGGPYRLCRNPMVAGALLAYLGLTAAIAGVWAALAVWVPLVGVAVAYHKLVEERELALRFGAEYEAYRQRTPFLIPTLRSLRCLVTGRDPRVG